MMTHISTAVARILREI